MNSVKQQLHTQQASERIITTRSHQPGRWNLGSAAAALADETALTALVGGEPDSGCTTHLTQVT